MVACLWHTSSLWNNPCRLLANLALTFVVASLVVPAAVAQDVILAPPTTAPVLDPFRLEDGKYGPGNRGIEYDTKLSDKIVAAASGTVVFAGPVAGSLFVSISHGSGLVTSYGFVANIIVREGQAVMVGDLVALAAGPFHFSVRLNGEYLDPQPLFGVRRQRLRLVMHRQEIGGFTQVLTKARVLSRTRVRLTTGFISLGRYQIGVDEYLSTYVIPGRFGARHGL